MPSMADVARKAGVSRATVSKVLNGKVPGEVSQETADRVLRAVRELGYVPNRTAQNLRRGIASETPVVLVSQIARWAEHPFFGTLFYWVERTLTAKGHQLQFVNVAPEGIVMERGLSILRAASPMGAILVGDLAERTLPVLQSQGIPVVTIEAYEKVGGCTQILVDNRVGMDILLRHLYGLGHRRIALVAYQEPDCTEYPAFRERREAYLEVVRELEIEPLVVWAKKRSETDDDVERGYEAAIHLFEDHQPTAVVALTDLLATGILRASGRLRLSVPGDVSVAGFDDIAAARYVTPPLTTMAIPARQLAQLAIERLLSRRRDGLTAGERIMVEPELVRRKSTSTPREGDLVVNP